METDMETPRQPDGEKTAAGDSDWTDEERSTCLAVRDALVKQKGLKPSQIGEVELIAITLNSKCRVAEAVDKFMTYHEKLLGEYGISDVWADTKELDDQWHRLLPAGLDEGGRQIMWVHGGGTPVEEEARCIRSCCLFFFAVHADRFTLRNGISLVIDTSNAPKKKVGNEKKLQVAWQNFPTRPQGIYILGTTTFTRIAVNALIAFASLFAKNKVIARIRFSGLTEMRKKMGEASMPQMHGGEPRVPTAQWVRERLAQFPKMGLPEYI
jgi:hypothetical protein